MELITKCLCKASNIGVNGNLFGGSLLSWADEAGAIMAMQICKTRDMVTVKMDCVEFKTPVKENHVVAIYGEVSFMGKSSVGIKLIANRQDIYSGDETEVCSINATFVRTTPDGKARPIDSEIRALYFDKPKPKK